MKPAITPDNNSDKHTFAKVVLTKFPHGENMFFTADTHFGHAHMIRYGNRPFRDVEEMDAELVRRWNETVSEDSLVFHLGDFCMSGAKDWNGLLDRLNGRIYLILGNHDMKNIRNGFMSRFEMVTQQMTIRVGGQAVILNHNPFLAYGGAYRDVWQLFGHVHSGPLSHTGLDLPRLRMLFPLQYDVGVDNNDFRPVSFEEVREKIAAQVEAARKAAGLDVGARKRDRLVVFFDPEANPVTETQKAAYGRLAAAASDVIAMPAGDAASLKEEIARRVAAFSAGVRYVYVGMLPLEDFRCVVVDRSSGLTEGNVDTAIRILK